MKTGNFYIKWRYEPISTWCIIYQEGSPIALGRVAQYYKDKYCKHTGRKLSLAKALKDAGLSKEQRKQVWEDYRMMTPKKRW